MSSLYNCFLRPILFFLAFTHIKSTSRAHQEQLSVWYLPQDYFDMQIKPPTFRLVDDLPCLYQEVEQEFSVKN